MSSERALTFYDVLGIPMDADDSAIRAAYKRRLAQCHRATCRSADNDSFCFLTEEEEKQSETAVKVVQKAYYVLSTPKLRAWYDEQLLGPHAALRRKLLQQQQQRQQQQQPSYERQPDTEAPQQPHDLSLTGSLSTRTQQPAARASTTGSDGGEGMTASAVRQQSPGELQEKVNDFTTPDGGRVHVVERTDTDPTSGAVYHYKSVSYTNTSTDLTQQQQQPTATVPVATATTTTTADQGEVAVPPSNTAIGAMESRTGATAAKSDVKVASCNSNAPVIQDFDPGMLSLLPGRMQQLLGQLLTAPLPSVELLPLAVPAVSSVADMFQSQSAPSSPTLAGAASRRASVAPVVTTVIFSSG